MLIQRKNAQGHFLGNDMKQIQMIANAPKRFLSQNIRSKAKRILEGLGMTSSSFVKI